MAVWLYRHACCAAWLLEALSLGFASSLHPQRTLICNAVDRSADAENSLATNEQLEAQRDKGGGAGDGQRVPSAAARKLIVDEVDGVDGGSDDGGEAEAAEAKESALVREAAAAAEAKAAPAAARAQALTPISRRRNEFTELMRGAANAAVENPMRPSSRDASGPMARAPSEAAVGNSGGEEEGAAAGHVHMNRHGSIDIRSPRTFKAERARRPHTHDERWRQ